ncbi:MAG: (d)CMP kinase [Acidaminococcales bacterium]|nr:(d)CMP kinase [Acidaminococcales bacterium]
MANHLVVAIDGPAGAGKSTVAKLVAARLGFAYIDTGAMYRAVALVAIRAGALGDKAAIEKIAADINISFRPEGEINRVFIEDGEITGDIRTAQVSAQASFVSSLPGVRAAMLVKQRALGMAGSVVMDGRDVGTCIFPAAQVKVFLTADSLERARRRYVELVAGGQTAELKELQKEMDARDKADSERAIAPLKKAGDAVEIDSSRLSIGQTVDLIVALAKAKGKTGESVL